MTTMTAGDLLALLSNHYNAPNRPKGWLLAPEIAAPHSDRRADLIAAPLTHSGGSAIVGHEIKVSRADVLAELADPTKHDDWARYCDRWWLVVADPALVAGLDIPEHWGVMAPPSGRRKRSMTVLQDAPQLSPMNTSDAWTKLARWQSWRADDAVRDAAVAARQQARDNEYLTRQLQELREASDPVTLSPHVHRAIELIEKVKALSVAEGMFSSTNLDEIAAAVVDTEATRRAARQQRTLIQHTQNMLAPRFADLTESLERAKRLGDIELSTTGGRT